MSVFVDRGIFGHFLIGLILTIGGWLFFVHPRLDGLRQLRATVAEHRERSSSLSISSSDEIAERGETLRLQIAAIEDKSMIARESSELYARIRSLAQQEEVQVTNLQSSTAPSPGQDSSILVSRIDLTVKGRYEQVAKFIEALDQFGGYLRPTSLMLSSAQVAGEPVVSARFGCEALCFTIPAELTQFQEAAHGDS